METTSNSNAEGRKDGLKVTAPPRFGFRRCVGGSVYIRLRAVGAKVLDFAPPGKRSRKAVPASTVFELEVRHMRRLR